MATVLPEGEDVRRAVKWISGMIQEHPDQPVKQLVQQAIFKFNLSPRDSEFLISFFKHH